MSKIHSIETLHQSGHSNREIARLLSVDRGTVNAYVRRLKGQNRPDPQTGATDSSADSVEELSGSETGSDESQPDPQTGSSDPVVTPSEIPHVRSGPRSLCDGYREQIEQKLEAGLSVQRILQDLKEDGFKGSYHSVRRFIVSLAACPDSRSSGLSPITLSCAAARPVRTRTRIPTNCSFMVGLRVGGIGCLHRAAAASGRLVSIGLQTQY
ncbi:MAG: helix-turn-helix domain-containing protein [Rhodopirellula sp.]|nr:helix-turn-helix domain-containing protein [Rhodopirellula sp.]